MRLVGFASILLLAGCADEYIIVGCPPSDGWTSDQRLEAEWEAQNMKKQYPEAARELEEYRGLKADRCAYYSGLKAYE